MSRLGPYTLGDLLGEGGMAQVFAARHARTGDEVALKVIRADVASAASARTLFEREVQAVATLHHPGIVRVFDSGLVTEKEADPTREVAAGAPWMAMEILPPSTLADRVTAPFYDVARWMTELLDALSHAHAHGVLHRDIKPGNLIEDTQGRLRLVDFGIAHLGGRGGLTSRNSRESGTPLYMAPEVFSSGLLGPWTDLYAVGCVAHELLAGAPPFAGTNVFALVQAHVMTPPPRLPAQSGPAGIQQWLDRLLAKAPSERFQRASDAARSLAALTGQDVPRPPLPAHLPSPHQAPERRSGLGLVGVGRLPFTGRRAEQDALWSALREAVDHRDGRGVVLTGPAGVGRSRLAQRVAAAAHEQGATVAVASGGDSQPLASLLRAALWLPGQLHEDMAETLAPMLQDSDRGWLADAVCELVNGQSAAPEAERLSITLAALRAVGPGRPLVLVLDDAVSNPLLLRLADRLLSQAPYERLPLMLVLTARDGDGSPDARGALNNLRGHPKVATLPLRPLPSADHRRLIGRMLDLDPDLARELEQRSQGRAWFAAQLVGELARSGGLLPGPRGHVLASGVTLPRDVHAFWEARLTRALQGLPPGDIQAAQLLAVGDLHTGDPLWLSACGQLGVSPSAELVPALLRGQLVSAAAAPRISDPNLRETILRKAKRDGVLHLLHSACADAHRAANAPILPRCRAWARHLLAARRPLEVPPMLGAQVRWLEELSDPAAVWDVEQLLRQALKDGGVAPADSRWVELLTVPFAHLWRTSNHAALGGRGEQVLAACAGRVDPANPPPAESISWSGDPYRFWSLKAEGLRAIADARRAAGQFDEASALLNQARELAQAAHDPASLVSLEWSMGFVARYQGDLPTALRWFATSRDRARALGDLNSRLRATEAWAECLFALGRLEEGEAALQGCIEELNAGGSRRLLVSAYGTLAGQRLATGRLEGAEQLFETVRLENRRAGERALEAVTLNNIGECRRRAGDSAAAERIYEDVVQLFEGTDSVWSFLPWMNLTIVAAQRGDWAAASQWLDELFPELERHGWTENLSLARTLRATQLAAQQRWRESDLLVASLAPWLRDARGKDPDIDWVIDELLRLGSER